MEVNDVMTRPIITEDEGVAITKVVKDMRELGIGSVVITKEGKPVGMITERDIALNVVAEDKRGSEMKAGEIISSPLITIEPKASVEEASELMAKKGIKRLPVVKNGVPIGIISVRNILTRKSEHVKRFYPRVHVLASGWTLGEIEELLSECKSLLEREGEEESYKEALTKAHTKLKELADYYVDDKELKDVFDSVDELYSSLNRPLDEQKRRLEDILRKFRHITFWRKRQSVYTDLGKMLWFPDYRAGIRGQHPL